MVGTQKNHPVRLRLPPLHRRGMVWHYTCADTRQPPRQAAPATPPQEGNGLALYLCRYEATTPSDRTAYIELRGNHPVRLRLPPLGGEWSGTIRADTRQPPRQAAPATPPEPTRYLSRYEATTPLRLPLHRMGMVRHYLCRYETTPSGCACHPSTGGEWSGTILVQIRGNHPVR